MLPSPPPSIHNISSNCPHGPHGHHPHHHNHPSKCGSSYKYHYSHIPASPSDAQRANQLRENNELMLVPVDSVHDINQMNPALCGKVNIILSAGPGRMKISKEIKDTSKQRRIDNCFVDMKRSLWCAGDNGAEPTPISYDFVQHNVTIHDRDRGDMKYDLKDKKSIFKMYVDMEYASYSDEINAAVYKALELYPEGGPKRTEYLHKLLTDAGDRMQAEHLLAEVDAKFDELETLHTRFKGLAEKEIGASPKSWVSDQMGNTNGVHSCQATSQKLNTFLHGSNQLKNIFKADRSLTNPKKRLTAKGAKVLNKIRASRIIKKEMKAVLEQGLRAKERELNLEVSDQEKREALKKEIKAINESLEDIKNTSDLAVDWTLMELERDHSTDLHLRRQMVQDAMDSIDWDADCMFAGNGMGGVDYNARRVNRTKITNALNQAVTDPRCAGMGHKRFKQYLSALQDANNNPLLNEREIGIAARSFKKIRKDSSTGQKVINQLGPRGARLMAKNSADRLVQSFENANTKKRWFGIVKGDPYSATAREKKSLHMAAGLLLHAKSNKTDKTVEDYQRELENPASAEHLKYHQEHVGAVPKAPNAAKCIFHNAADFVDRPLRGNPMQRQAALQDREIDLQGFGRGLSDELREQLKHNIKMKLGSYSTAGRIQSGTELKKAL